MLQAAAPVLVLASGSATRRGLMVAAGLRFEVAAAGIDESEVKREAALLEESPEATALRLARLKARAVARPGSLVIGCDQILVCDGVWYDKPATLAIARAHLQALRGRQHCLATATTAMRDGEELWHYAAAPRLTMRRFTDAFLEAYLRHEGAQVLDTVGAYRLEGMGLQLFDSVQGEHSAILGLPMLPLLGFLRSRNIIGT